MIFSIIGDEILSGECRKVNVVATFDEECIELVTYNIDKAIGTIMER